MKAYTMDLRERVVKFVVGVARGAMPLGAFGCPCADSRG